MTEHDHEWRERDAIYTGSHTREFDCTQCGDTKYIYPSSCATDNDSVLIVRREVKVGATS